VVISLSPADDCRRSMNPTRLELLCTREPLAPRRSLRWFGAVFGLVFPAVATWGYFVIAAQFTMAVQQSTYLVVKSIQFAFPAVWMWLVLRERPKFHWPESRGLWLGAEFSIVVVGVGWVVFWLLLRDAAPFAAAAPKIRDKIVEFGIDSPGKYVALGVFYSLLHSLMEEYYWRWFVFRQLREVMALWPAIFVSSIGFMAHHVIVLGEFFQEARWLAWLLASAVAVGGVFWAWLYQRSQSLYSAWLSHLLIDAGIFWVGYDLVRETLAAF
jgi:membrane protease YdiL (CAAX protease family)